MAIGAVVVGGDAPLALLAGPCAIEDEPHALRTAETLLRMTSDAGVPLVYKSSYDKANRSSARSYRGPGLREGLRILARVKAAFGCPVLSDVHLPSEVDAAAEVLDLLQIPAFLCRQTDLVLACGRSGRPVSVKKGQFMAPWDMENVVDKLRSVGCEDVLLTERGASFGYNNLVVDMRAFPILRSLGFPVVYDVTHSLQLPGAGEGVTAGQAEFIEPMASAGVAAGVDGVFMEVHDNPKEAKSDGANALDSRKLRGVLKELLAVQKGLAKVHATP